MKAILLNKNDNLGCESPKFQCNIKFMYLQPLHTRTIQVSMLIFACKLNFNRPHNNTIFQDYTEIYNSENIFGDGSHGAAPVSIQVFSEIDA